jgi:hypothetical protein
LYGAPEANSPLTRREAALDLPEKRSFDGLPAGPAVLAVHDPLVADLFHFVVEEEAAAARWAEGHS